MRGSRARAATDDARPRGRGSLLFSAGIGRSIMNGEWGLLAGNGREGLARRDFFRENGDNWGEGWRGHVKLQGCWRILTRWVYYICIWKKWLLCKIKIEGHLLVLICEDDEGSWWESSIKRVTIKLLWKNLFSYRSRSFLKLARRLITLLQELYFVLLKKFLHTNIIILFRRH